MTVEAVSSAAERPRWQPNYRRSRQVEALIKSVCFLFAAVSVLTTVGIILTLVFETFDFFRDDFFQKLLWLKQVQASNPNLSVEQLQGLTEQVEKADLQTLTQQATTVGTALPSRVSSFFYAVQRFFTDNRWTPLFQNPQFGIFVLVSATLLTSFIAISVALPLGLLVAIFLSEYASRGARKVLKPILEILAGVPSVVFGYFALLTVTPVLQQVIPGLEGFNALSAGLVLGISITPLVASLSEDAIYAVPQSLRDGSAALGATRRETVISVILPAALSGIVASAILAISRAIGETMIVSLAAGQNPQPITPDLAFLDARGPVMTMTAFIVQVSLGDTPVGSLAYKTIFAVGMALFMMTLLLNSLSYWFVRRFREKYE